MGCHDKTTGKKLYHRFITTLCVHFIQKVSCDRLTRDIEIDISPINEVPNY